VPTRSGQREIHDRGVAGVGRKYWYGGKASVVDSAYEKGVFDLFIILLDGKTIQSGLSYFLDFLDFPKRQHKLLPLRAC